MSNSTRNGSNGLILGLLVFLFVGNYLQLEQIFLNYAFLGMIVLNMGLILTNFRSTSRQMSYYFTWILFVGIFYAIIKFYILAPWAWIVATAFIGFNLLSCVFIRDRPTWEVKVSRDGFSLLMIIFEHSSLTALLVLSITFAIFLLFEEYHQIIANQAPRIYAESEKLYFSLSWFYSIGMFLGLYLAERNAIVQILLLSYCGVFVGKLLFMNPKKQFLEQWPWITAVYLGINLIITALSPEFLYFLKLFIPLSIWIVGSYLTDKFGESSTTHQRNIRIGLITAWAIGSSIILNAYLLEILVLCGFIFFIAYLLEQNDTVKILNYLILNVILICLCNPYAVQNIVYYDYFGLGYFLGEWGIILLILVEGLVLLGFFIQFLGQPTSISKMDSFLVTVCMKAALTLLLWNYLGNYIISYDLSQLFLEIQLGSAFGLVLISVLLQVRKDTVKDLGFYLQIYAAVMGIISLYVLRTIHSFYTNIYYALGFGGFFVLLAWITNGQSSKNFETIKESIQEVSTLMMSGMTIITLWFILVPEYTIQFLLIIYCGLFIGLRTVHRNKLVCALYSLGAQVLWLVIIAMEWISGDIFGVMIIVGLGFGLFFITDLVTFSHSRSIPLFMWIATVFIPVMSYTAMESFVNLWFVITPAILIFTLIYFKVEASWLGGLNSFKSLIRVWILIIAPSIALTFYYATFRSWLVLSGDLNYIAWAVYIGSIVLEVTLIFVFRSKVQSRDLLKMVDQKIHQEEKKQKTAKTVVA